MSTIHTNLTDQAPAFRTKPRRGYVARGLRRRPRIRAGLVQLLAAAGALVLAFVAPQIHAGFEIPTGRTVDVLIAIGTATVTFIGIVFSLLFLVVQFGSSAFTPRLNLFRDAPVVWRSFALYNAVVVYSFTAALVIGRDASTTVIVPLISFVGVLASIGVYRRLQMRAFQSIQLAPMLSQVARRGRDVIDSLYTDRVSVPDPTDRPDRQDAVPAAELHEIRWPHRVGILQVIDVPRVLRAVERTQTEIEFTVGTGELLAEGALVAVITGPAEPTLEGEILQAVTVGEERTFEQDPALALRLLEDIALRALSPAVNDPTTAVQALDTMDGLLRVLAVRDLSVGQVAASDGVVRLTLVLPTWDDYLGVALDEIIALQRLSPNVSRRIVKLLDDLAAVAPASRQPAIAARRNQLCTQDALIVSAP